MGQVIIGLVGFAGSGKDTVGDILVNQYGFKREAFANSLKDVAAIIFGWDRTKLDGSTPENRAWREVPDPYWSKVLNKFFTPRLALQLLGTEAGRQVFGESIWTASTLKRIKDDPTNNYVVTDVRFNNEIDHLSRADAMIALVHRGKHPDYYNDAFNYNMFDKFSGKPYPESLKDIHQSEWDWIGNPLIYYTIYNDSTLQDLEKRVLKVLEDL